MLWYGTIAAAIVAGSSLLFLKPRLQVFIALFVMTLCFDLLPRLVMNWDVWDFGALLLLVAGGKLLFQPQAAPPPFPSYAVVLSLFLGWIVFALVWSLVLYDYSIEHTLKASRQMLIGYLSFFIFRRLFAVDQEALPFLLRSLYSATFTFLIVSIIQYATGIHFLQGLVREYAGMIRYVPVFLPFCLLHLWRIVANQLSAKHVAWHEYVYVALVGVVTALTFTRGIYLIVAGMFLLLLLTLIHNRTICIKQSLGVLSALVLGLLLILGTGSHRMLDRLTSGIDILLTGNSTRSQHNVDTFTNRLALAKERFEMVAAHNPLVGYGFLHEDHVPSSLRKKLRYGSVIYTPEYVARYLDGYPYVLAFHSADIGWADVVVNTGFVGLALLILFMAVLIKAQYARRNGLNGLGEETYNLRLAFFVQILAMALLMFESGPFVTLVQIPALLVAGHVSLSRGAVHAEAETLSKSTSPLLSS